MGLDTLGVNALLHELRPLLVGTHLQQLVFPEDGSLAFSAYAPGRGRVHVLASAHPERARVQRLVDLPARDADLPQTPFLLLARKHLRGARVAAVSQPALDRVLEFGLAQRSDDGTHYGLRLIVEVMGRRSNLVLVAEDGSILDAWRRSPPSRNPVRPVLPHYRYASPPAQSERLVPDRSGLASLASEARGRGGNLAKLLVDRLAGMSPLAARELAFRATGSSAAPLGSVDWQRLADEAAALFAPLGASGPPWEPCVARLDGAVAEYAAYPLRHLQAEQGATLERVDSMSEAIAAAQGTSARAPRRAGDALAGQRAGLLGQLELAVRATEKRRSALAHQLEGSAAAERLRRWGETLLSYQHLVQPGAAALAIDGEVVPLEPGLSAVETAQAYFARYTRLRDAARQVPDLLAEADARLEHLATLRALVDMAPDAETLRALRQEVVVASGGPSEKPPRKSDRGVRPSQQRRGGPRGYRRLALRAGGGEWEALIGTTAAGNAAVTFDVAAGDDLWLHVRAAPGAHVVVRARLPGEPPPAVIEEAASLAAWFSSARESGSVEVDVAPRRHVRKVPGGPPGLVRYSHERTLRVAPRGPRPAAVAET